MNSFRAKFETIEKVGIAKYNTDLFHLRPNLKVFP